MNIFKKKFATKVEVYARTAFTVSYSSYRIFPVWNTLLEWQEFGLDSNLHGWVEKIFLQRKDAEKAAKSINSLEDVKIFYKEDENKESDFYRRRKEYFNSLDTSTKIYKKQ